MKIKQAFKDIAKPDDIDNDELKSYLKLLYRGICRTKSWYKRNGR